MPQPAEKPPAPNPTAVTLAARLAESGLALPQGDLAKLEPMAAELAVSAAMIRKQRSYLEEPAHTLNLRSK